MLSANNKLLAGMGTLFGIGVVTLFLLSLISAPLALVSLSGSTLLGATGGGLCLPIGATPSTPSTPSTPDAPQTPVPVPTATGTATTSTCSPPTSSGTGAGVAAAALSIAQHLAGVPDAWYDAGIPRPALAFWASACPAGSGCWLDWQEGNLQCVMLVTGTYVLAGLPLPASGNALDFWSLYQNRPGWIEIPSAAAPPAQRGLPAPGDIIVWWDAPPAVGHVAVALAVQPPFGGHNGSITYAQANGPHPIETMVLMPDLSVATWPGYAVLGYIRPASHTSISLITGGSRQQGAVTWRGGGGGGALLPHLFTHVSHSFIARFKHASIQKGGTTNR